VLCRERNFHAHSRRVMRTVGSHVVCLATGHAGRPATSKPPNQTCTGHYQNESGDMSHTWVMDKIGRPLVNFAARLLFDGEHCQKRHFNGEGFVNVATEMIAQFLEATDAFQDFSGAEARCECGSFFFCMCRITLRHAIARPTNISPPGE